MLPCLTPQDKVGAFAAYAVLLGQFLLCVLALCVLLSDLSNFLFGQFGAFVVLAVLATAFWVGKRNLLVLLGNMKPILSARDSANRFTAYAKALSQFSLSIFVAFVQRSYFFNLYGCYLNSANSLPARSAFGLCARAMPPITSSIKASFCGAIASVFSWASREKMGAVTAGWIIARVAYKFIRRIIAMLQQKCNTMRLQGFARDCELSVTSAEAGCFPGPAFIIGSSLNVKPKPVNVRWRELRNSLITHGVIIRHRSAISYAIPTGYTAP